MMADAVEAASRVLTDPTPARIASLVDRIINHIFLEGQLDECELTLKDIHEIKRRFTYILTGIFHKRIDYPGFDFSNEGLYKESPKAVKAKSAEEARLLRKALRLLGLHTAEISILFVGDKRMRMLNRRYRGIDRTTDVLSFPQNEYSAPNGRHRRTLSSETSLSAFRKPLCRLKKTGLLSMKSLRDYLYTACCISSDMTTK